MEGIEEVGHGGQHALNPLISQYRSGLADSIQRMNESFKQLVRLSEVTPTVEPGADECLGIDLAVEQMLNNAEALCRVAQELRVREMLGAEKEINAEVAQAKKTLSEANAKIEACVARVHAECKSALEEIAAECSRI